ncbi:DNA polymerase kappa [Pelomyxa schiedti]|nr:DNA polymerase kappa [Pelomyxa schiedti]
MELLNGKQQFAVTRKAGMQDLDLDETNEFIYQLSKNTRFFRNEQKKDSVLQQRADELLRKLDTLPPTPPEMLQHIDEIVSSVEASRDLSQSWLHLDMDAFYASIEIADNPELEGKPIAVGSMDMLATSSYEARRFGVRAGLPGFIALQLCPALEIVPLRMERYHQISGVISSILSRYDPSHQMLSLDEASLNISNYCTLNSIDPLNVASRIKEDILRETHLTCSVGIATTNTLAKICAEIRKPNGIYLMTANSADIILFMADLPIRKVPGIGKVMERMLQTLGITKCGQLALAREVIFQLFPGSVFLWFVQIWLGVVASKSQRGRVHRSISRERTLRDFLSLDELHDCCADLCSIIASELSRLQSQVSKMNFNQDVTSLQKALKLTVKVKSQDFEVRNSSVALSQGISRRYPDDWCLCQ